MTFWQYFNVGKGKFIPFSKLHFQSCLKVIDPFYDANIVSENSKNRKYRALCTTLLCPESGCLSTFDNIVNLQTHVETRNHEFTINDTSMDVVKTHFADLVQKSSHQHIALSSNNEMNTISAMEIDCSLLKKFQQPGWALLIFVQ